MSAFPDLGAGGAGMVEQQRVEVEAGKPDGLRGGRGGAEIDQEVTPAGGVDAHGVEAVRAERVDLAGEAEIGQEAGGGGVDVLRAGLVAREAGLVEEEDAVTACGQQRRAEAARGTAADHDDVGVIPGPSHLSGPPCIARPPCGTGGAW